MWDAHHHQHQILIFASAPRGGASSVPLHAHPGGSFGGHRYGPRLRLLHGNLRRVRRGIVRTHKQGPCPGRLIGDSQAAPDPLRRHRIGVPAPPFGGEHRRHRRAGRLSRVQARRLADAEGDGGFHGDRKQGNKEQTRAVNISLRFQTNALSAVFFYYWSLFASLSLMTLSCTPPPRAHSFALLGEPEDVGDGRVAPAAAGSRGHVLGLGMVKLPGH